MWIFSIDSILVRMDVMGTYGDVQYLHALSILSLLGTYDLCNSLYL